MITYTDPSLVSEVIVDDAAPRYGAGADGYGRKVPTRYRLRYAGRVRRVYMAVFGNAGSAYVVVGGEDRVLDTDTEHRIYAAR
jgi:hypothetical protein